MRLPQAQIIWVASATALSLLGDQALYALLPIYFQELGLVPIQVGLLLSANRWIRLLTNHLAERLVRTHASTGLLVLSFLLGALLTFYYAQSQSFLLLLVARLLWGLCWSFIRHISMMTVATQTAEGQMGQMMGYYNGISRTGSVAGILLGGILFDTVGFQLTFLIFATVSVIAVPLGWQSQRRTRHADMVAQWKHDESPVGFRALMICGFSLGCVGPGLIMSTLGFVLAGRYGSERAVAGIILGIATVNGLLLGTRWILESLAAPFLGAFVDRIGIHKGAPVFFVAGTVSLCFLSVTTSVLTLVTGILVFFFSATALQAVITGHAGKQGSRVYARFASSSDIGAAVGPLLGWTAVELSGQDIVFMLATLFYALGTVSAWAAFYGKNSRRESG
ncbi:MAG: MFS transporter [Pseudomonadales bacterium]|nr:MFS transporter [Pseudomonadales bacterium]MDP7359263.1 MFS transporter [Pseudomonadales bacterium]MDP7596406.1 MFS transporter [Pseudomonadales bacterium]HJN50137.1 MFS transporter [Pseudomonadales bacterium]